MSMYIDFFTESPIGKNFEIETKALNIETKKKVKTILVPFCMNSKKVANFVFRSIKV